jgi:hypothetical protein
MLVSTTAELEGTKATLEFRDTRVWFCVTDLLLVGRVAARTRYPGQIVVNPETELRGRPLQDGPGAADRSGGSRPARTKVRGPSVLPGTADRRLEGVETMNDAEALAARTYGSPSPRSRRCRRARITRTTSSAARRTLPKAPGWAASTSVEGSIDRSYLVVDEHLMNSAGRRHRGRGRLSRRGV